MSTSTSSVRHFSSLFSQNGNGNNVSRAANSAIARQKSTVLSKDQLQCIDRLEDCVDRVLACKRRDMHFTTLQRCIASFTDDADKDEPLTANSFSVYDCYRTFTQELIYFPDKFDFLIFCVLHRVCIIHKPAQFHQMLNDLLMPATTALAQRVGGELLSRLIQEDEMREEDEIARVEAFCLKKDWVPKYSANSPLNFLKKKEEEEKELVGKEKQKRDAKRLWLTEVEDQHQQRHALKNNNKSVHYF